MSGTSWILGEADFGMEKDHNRVLLVDDAANIRLTMSEVLRGMDLTVMTAASGQEALGHLSRSEVRLVFLDLRLPDIEGLEVLRRARNLGSEAIFVIITAHGTVDSAIEAMRLGAVDYLQKPFTPDEVRGVVRAILDREETDHSIRSSYSELIETAIRAISKQRLGEASGLITRALSLDSQRPEAHNLRGVLHEIDGDRFSAQQCYRRALSADPTYEPARANLRQSVEPSMEGSFLLQEVKKTQ